MSLIHLNTLYVEYVLQLVHNCYRFGSYMWQMGEILVSLNLSNIYWREKTLFFALSSGHKVIFVPRAMKTPYISTLGRVFTLAEPRVKNPTSGRKKAFYSTRYEITISFRLFISLFYLTNSYLFLLVKFLVHYYINIVK